MGLGTEAASLFVKVTGDVSDATSKLNSVGEQAEKTGGILKGAIGTAIGFGAATVAMSGFGSILGTIKDGAIGMNSQLETSTLQFTTLMGSSDRAEAHVKSLFDFAAHTPFETGPIIEASRIMQTFGGDALNSKANLTLFGDAAAATSQPINDIAFWMSRAYAAIQGGQPFGEARMRLMEMGVITPQVAAKLDELSASGASADQVWGALSGSLGKYSGAMEKQAQTWDGITSTLSDSIKMTIATAGKPLFDMLKNLITAFNNLVASPAFQGKLLSVTNAIAGGFTLLGKGLGFAAAVARTVATAISPVTKALGDILAPLPKIYGAFLGLLDEGIDIFWDELANALGTTTAAFQPLISIVDTVISTVSGLVGQIGPFVTMLGEQLAPVLQIVSDNLGTIAQVVVGAVLGPWSTLVSVFRAVSSGASDIGGALATMQQSFLTNIGTLISNIVPALATLAGKLADWVLESLPGLLQNLASWLQSMAGFLIDHLPDIAAKLAEWGGALIGWILPRLPGLLENLLSFVVSMVGWIITQGIPKLIGAALKMGGGLVSGVIDAITGKGGNPGLLAQFGNWITGSLIPGILGFIPKLLQAGADMAGALGRGFANALVGFIEGAINAVIRGINSFKIPPIVIDLGPLGKQSFAGWGGLRLPYVSLPRFEKGTLDTGLHSGLAILDPHEAVIPRDLADQLRGGGGLGGGGASTVVQVYIGDFHGTEENIAKLGEELGKVVRFATLRRTAVGYGGGR